jgi:hypothetical protein
MEPFRLRCVFSACLACALWTAAAPAGARTITVALPSGSGSLSDNAIQAAIASAGAGDTVLFPAGTYAISKSILPKAGQMLTGPKAGAALIDYQGTASAPLIALDGLSDIEVAYLTLRGNANGRNGVSANYGKGHFLHHLIIRDFTAKTGMVLGVHFTAKVYESVIADNVFENMAVENEWGGGVRLSAGCSHNRVLRNAVRNSGRGGFLLDNSPANILQGDTATGSGLGLGGTAPGLGLEVWGGCDSSLIEDNTLDHWLSVDGSPYTAVRRNRVGTADGTFKHCGLELVSSSHCVFTGNRVTDGAHLGISISNQPAKDDVYWAYNDIAKASTWAMQMQGDSGGASYHYFYGNRFTATAAHHPLALYANQGHALRFNAACFHIAFDSNEIADNGGAALNFLGDLEDFSFTRNRFSGNGSMATAAFPGSRLAWSGNTVTGPGAAPAAKGSSAMPVAIFTAPAESKVGETVHFANASQAASGSVLAHDLWDFDDGLPSTETQGEHAYARAGTYRVCLVVWNRDGQGSRLERILTVKGGGTALHRASRTVAAGAIPNPQGRDWLGRKGRGADGVRLRTF